MARFGLAVIPEGSPGQVIELCVLAESLGFDSVWIADEGPEFYDPFVILAQVALRTESIGLGIGITNPYMRHPALLASAMLSLQDLSNGRAILGIGAGGSVPLSKLGLSREKPVETLRMTIEALRGIFAAKPVNISSEAFKIHGVKWPANSKLELPVYVGAKGEQIIKLASRYADGLILSTLPTGYLHDTVEGLHPRKQNFDTAYISRLCISENQRTARDLVRPSLAFAVADYPLKLLEEIGLTARGQLSIREELAAGRPTVAARLISDDMVDALAIVGTIKECKDAVFEKLSTGITRFMAAAPFGPSPIEALKAFSTQIMTM